MVNMGDDAEIPDVLHVRNYLIFRAAKVRKKSKLIVIELQVLSLKTKAYIRHHRLHRPACRQAGFTDYTDQSSFMNQLELLEKIIQNLDRSSIAYAEYLKYGKTYQYACELRKYNTSMLNMLVENGQLLSQDLQDDASALITHLKIWTEKWDALKQELDPAPGDEFVFENEHRFPREAAKHLELEYFRLKES